MAEILKAVRSHILGTTSVSDLVGTRVYWQRLEQNATLPAVVLKELSNEAAEHLLGTSGLSTTRVQIDCYATSYPAAFALREAIRQRLHAYRGTSQSVVIRSVAQGSRQSLFLEPRDGDDVGKHVATIDFLVTHSETALTS